MADRTTFDRLNEWAPGDERLPDDKERVAALLRMLQEHTAATEQAASGAQRRAMIMNSGPLGWYAHGLNRAGRIAGDKMEEATGSRLGADPISAGLEGQKAWPEAEALLQAHRQAQAKKLMDALFLAPLAQRQ